MSRHPLLSLATLAALCAAAAAQAQTPATHGSHATPAKVASAKTPQKSQAKTVAVKKTGYSAHRKSCMSRYKTYNANSDTYLLKGKRVRCKL